MNLLRWWKLRKARRARTVRASRAVIGAIASANAANAARSTLLLHIERAARERPLVVRSGQCAVCGAWSLVLKPFQPLEGEWEMSAPDREAATCATCTTATVMLGATDAGR